MKTIKYFTLFLLVAFVMSCKVSSPYDIEGRRTMFGAVAFEEVSLALYENSRVMTLAQIVDLYMNASTQSERDNIQRVYLPYYKITVSGNECILSKDMEWKFDTHGHRLNAPRAEWSVQCDGGNHYPYIYIPDGGYTIKKAEGTTWLLKIDGYNMASVVSQGELTIQYAEPSEQDVTPTSSFALTGRGEVSSIGNFMIRYNIDQGLVCHSSRLNSTTQESQMVTKSTYTSLDVPYLPHVYSQFMDGKLSMEVEKGSPVQNTAVMADMTQSTGSDIFVEISMSGISEPWRVMQ